MELPELTDEEKAALARRRPGLLDRVFKNAEEETMKDVQLVLNLRVPDEFNDDDAHRLVSGFPEVLRKLGATDVKIQSMSIDRRPAEKSPAE